MDRYRKEVLQVSTRKHGINVQYLYDSAYNAKCKMLVQNRNSVTEKDVKDCMAEFKNKKCEEFDRIPLCMLSDASEKLHHPMVCLFKEIYLSCKIPEQWKVAKKNSICKKCTSNHIMLNQMALQLHKFVN